MTVSIRLPADLVEKLDKLAHDAKRARAAEIWLALEKWVEQQHRG